MASVSRAPALGKPAPSAVFCLHVVQGSRRLRLRAGARPLSLLVAVVIGIGIGIAGATKTNKTATDTYTGAGMRHACVCAGRTATGQAGREVNVAAQRCCGRAAVYLRCNLETVTRDGMKSRLASSPSLANGPGTLRGLVPQWLCKSWQLEVHGALLRWADSAVLLVYAIPGLRLSPVHYVDRLPFVSITDLATSSISCQTYKRMDNDLKHRGTP